MAVHYFFSIFAAKLANYGREYHHGESRGTRTDSDRI